MTTSSPGCDEGCNAPRPGGISPQARYEIDILDGGNVKGCFFRGEISDLRETIDKSNNTLDAPDPGFDELYRPRAKVYANVGYRPDLQE